MDRHNEKYKNRSHGFTLVEIIVVLVVLALLVAIMIPSMKGWIDEANKRKLAVACRACVNAAATLALEDYVEALRSDSPPLLVPPSDAEIRALAGIDTGRVALVSITQFAGRRIGSNVYSDPDYPPGTVEYLSYTDDEGYFATYVIGAANGSSSSRIVFSEPLTWSKGMEFKQGEIMQGIPGGAKTRSDGSDNVVLLRCMKTHKSGSRSNTRDPTVKSNKGTWEVIGTVDGKPAAYSPEVRFGVGCVVEYKGKLYYRTDFNLTGGQTPYQNTSSMYWVLIGPASASP